MSHSPAVTVHHGNSVDVLAGFGENSFDAIVTDPPYALTELPPRKVIDALTHWVTGDPFYVPGSGRGMQGEAWDRFVPPPGLWQQALRVLKPGGYAAVFAGARTQDLMGMALRIAGFEVRDVLAWIKPGGMPKAKGVMKPAYEPVLLCRKPFKGSAKANQERHGTAELQVERCRIPFLSAEDERESKEKNRHGDYGTLHGGNAVYGDFSMLGVRGNYDAPGRWPSNLLLTHDEGCVEAGPVEVRSNSNHPASRGKGGIGSSGHRGQDGLVARRAASEVVQGWDCAPGCPVAELEGQSLGASRFFFAPRANPAERPSYTGPDGKPVIHPTVKPLSVARWVSKLACPPGGLLLDPFAGTGTTGEAGALEGFDVVLVESEARYLPLIEQRVRRLGKLAA